MAGTEAPAVYSDSVAQVLEPAGYPVLRYEDRFFADAGTLGAVAEHIGAAVAADLRERIFARYTTEAVRTLAGQVEGLPAERVKGDPAIDLYDEVTQIHRGHIGDGSVEKWRRQLTAEQQQALTARFAPFLQRFGYT